jgi:uncharacterized protein YecE (DUF72 family)
LERPPGSKYTAELRFAELTPVDPLPKPATLSKWRKKLPEGFELGLRAPTAAWNPPEGPLRAGAALDAGVRWLTEAADALEASLIVVATDASVTTGARDRERLREYFGGLPRNEGSQIVWRASGLWEPEAVQSMARSLSVVAAFDAIDDPPPQGDFAYASLLAEGLRRSFAHAQLLDVLDKVQASGASAAYVCIESPQSFREARLLQALSEGRV